MDWRANTSWCSTISLFLDFRFAKVHSIAGSDAQSSPTLRNQWQSVAISSNQWFGRPIKPNPAQSVAISSNQWLGRQIKPNPAQSVAISGNRKPNPAPRRTCMVRKEQQAVGGIATEAVYMGRSPPVPPGSCHSETFPDEKHKQYCRAVGGE